MHTARTRGERAINWIERYCFVPNGPDKGEPVQLFQQHQETLRRIYDSPNGPQDMPVTAPSSAYLALLHVCGPEAKQKEFCPAPDVFSLWGAAGPDLRAVLKRDGEKSFALSLGELSGGCMTEFEPAAHTANRV